MYRRRRRWKKVQRQGRQFFWQQTSDRGDYGGCSKLEFCPWIWGLEPQILLLGWKLTQKRRFLDIFSDSVEFWGRHCLPHGPYLPRCRLCVRDCIFLCRPFVFVSHIPSQTLLLWHCCCLLLIYRLFLVSSTCEGHPKSFRPWLIRRYFPQPWETQKQMPCGPNFTNPATDWKIIVQQRVWFYAVCISTPDHLSLLLRHVITMTSYPQQTHISQ